MNILYFPKEIVEKAIEESYNTLIDSQDDESLFGNFEGLSIK